MRLRIEQITYGGDGLGRHDGVVWFVPRSVPGDLLEVRETATARNYRRGEIVEILDPSPHRAVPRCPWFDRCGGCQWQHIEYGFQVEAKSDILAESMRRIGGADRTPVEPLPSPATYEYRRRITLHCEGGEIGYRAAESRTLVPVSDCPIAAPPLRIWLGAPPLSREEREQLPRRFELRMDEDDGVELITDPAGASFRQTNAGGNRLLQALVAELIGSRIERPRLFDLYCGDGNLSLPLAQRAASITGWDSSTAAIDRARGAAAEFAHVSYRRGSVSRIRRELKTGCREVDLIIIDPPRQGIRREAQFLALLGIPRVLYVSCNPTTLARDAKAFFAAGYRIEHLQALDMFPQTYHLESILLLRR